MCMTAIYYRKVAFTFLQEQAPCVKRWWLGGHCQIKSLTAGVRCPLVASRASSLEKVAPFRKTGWLTQTSFVTACLIMLIGFCGTRRVLLLSVTSRPLD